MAKKIMIIPKDKLKPKKSFSMFFGGGEIWFEHLDGLSIHKDFVIEKFQNSIPFIKKPSTPALIAVNLDDTFVDDEIISIIINTFIQNQHYIRKVVFVGLDRNEKNLVKKSMKKCKDNILIAINCINDFEKAKEWLVGEL